MSFHFPLLFNYLDKSVRHDINVKLTMCNVQWKIEDWKNMVIKTKLHKMLRGMNNIQ